MDKQQMTDYYVNFLTGEGYRPRVDIDGDVVFKREGWTYLLLIDEDDPMLFVLSCMMQTDIVDDRSRRLALVAANEVTATTKVTKISILDDTVVGSVEMFVSPLEAFTPVFERCLTALQAGMSRFERQFTMK